MNAIRLLTDDHRELKRLLAEVSATTERAVKTRERLFKDLKDNLTIHEVIEEEIFYPELKAHPRARDIVLEGYEEHHVVDTIMAELSALPMDDEAWGAKCAVMQENVEHHMAEEEEDMFVKARQVFDPDELDQLGTRMQERKDSLLDLSRPISSATR